MALPKRTSVLIVGKTQILQELVDSLTSRNVMLTHVNDMAACGALLEHTDHTFALIISEAETLTPDEVTTLRQRTSAPLIWGIAPGKSDASTRSLPAVKLVHSLTPAVMAQINELMVYQIFNQDIAQAVRQCTIEAFSEGFATTTSVLQPFLAEVREPLHEVVAFIGFTGPQTSGYLSLNASIAYLEIVHKRLLKREKITDSLTRSTAGEMVNQVFGRFKAFLETHGVTVSPTFPIVLEGKLRNVNYRPGRVSLVHKFKAERNDLFVELCIDPVDIKLLKNSAAKVLQAGEMQFL